MSALDTQVGGDHYKHYPIQPAEYIIKNGLGFAEGCVVKYVTRWKDKNGVEDLKKARHFLDLLIEFSSPTKNEEVDGISTRADAPLFRTTNHRFAEEKDEGCFAMFFADGGRSQGFLTSDHFAEFIRTNTKRGYIYTTDPSHVMDIYARNIPNSCFLHHLTEKYDGYDKIRVKLIGTPENGS